MVMSVLAGRYKANRILPSRSRLELAARARSCTRRFPPRIRGTSCANEPAVAIDVASDSVLASTEMDKHTVSITGGSLCG
jgi:hypothetical protein